MENYMAGEIQSAFDVVYADGSETTPLEPRKSRIRTQVGGTIQAKWNDLNAKIDQSVTDLAGLIVTGTKPPVDPVDFRSTSTGALATAFVAGTVHDGVTAVAGRRFLMDGRPSPAENGLYTVPASGAPVRSADADTAAELPGISFLVDKGTENGGKIFVCATQLPITLGTTPLKFTQSGKSPSVVPSLAAGTAVTDPATSRFALLNAAGDVIQLIAWADLLAKINGEVMGPPTYVWPANKIVKSTSVEVIPADAGLQEYDIINSGDAPAYITEAGLPATIGGFGSIPIAAKGIYTTDKALAGPVNGISSGETLLTVKFRTRTNYNVAARAAAQAYTDKVNSLSPLTAAQVTVLQDFYSAIYTSGALANLGAFYNFVAPGLASFINLCDLDGHLAATVGTVTRTNWRYLTFDGLTGYLNTRRYLSEFARDGDHSLLVYPGSNMAQGSSRVAIGEAEVTLTPARTTTTVAGRSLDTVTYTPTGFTAGASLLSMSRTAPDKVIFRQGLSTKLEVASVASRLLSSRNLLIGARNVGPTGGNPEPSAGSFFTGPMIAVGAGRGLNDASHAAIQNAIAKLALDAGVF